MNTTIPLSDGAQKELDLIKGIHHSLILNTLVPMIVIGFGIFFLPGTRKPETANSNTIAALGIPLAIWLITFFFSRLHAQKKIKQLYQNNELDFRLSEQIKLYVQKLLDRISSGELNKVSIADRTTWRPYRVENYANYEGAGTFSGSGGGLFGGPISGTINLKITPELLQKSAIVYFVNDVTHQNLQVIILSPEVVVARIQKSIEKARWIFTDKFPETGIIAFGHTREELDKMAEVLTKISHQLGHTELINELALIATDKSEKRCHLQITLISEGLSLMEAAELGERGYVICPMEIPQMIDNNIIPLLKANTVN